MFTHYFITQILNATELEEFKSRISEVLQAAKDKGALPAEVKNAFDEAFNEVNGTNILEGFLQGLGVDLEEFRKDPTSIDLSKNKLSNEKIIIFADILRHNKTLKKVNLMENYIYGRSLYDLEESLKTNTTVATLDLRKVAFLPPPTPGSPPLFSSSLKGIFKMLAVNKSLITIYIANNNITEKDIGALADALKENKTLRHIILYENYIGDDGVKILAEALKENETLTTVDLRGCLMSEKGISDLAEALKTNKTLRHLPLGFNKIGDAGATALAEVLKTKNTSLLSISLIKSEVGDVGAKALLEALGTNTTLTQIDLEKNIISEDIKKEIAALLERNKGFAKELAEREAQFLGTAGAISSLLEGAASVIPYDNFYQLADSYGIPHKKMKIILDKEIEKIKNLKTIYDKLPEASRDEIPFEQWFLGLKTRYSELQKEGEKRSFEDWLDQK